MMMTEDGRSKQGPNTSNSRLKPLLQTALKNVETYRTMLTGTRLHSRAVNDGQTELQRRRLRKAFQFSPTSVEFHVGVEKRVIGEQEFPLMVAVGVFVAPGKVEGLVGFRIPVG